MNQQHDNIGFKSNFKHDKYGLIVCANCGKVETSNANGVCTYCLRDYRNFGFFYNSYVFVDNVNESTEKQILEWIDKDKYYGINEQ